MSAPYIAQITMFGGNFAPRGWAFCEGQLLAVSSNEALFSLIGTIYGGNGRTTFGLPDLRGRVPLHAGNGPGLSPYNVGARGGVEQTTVTLNELASHSHEQADGTGAGKVRASPLAASTSDATASSLAMAAAYNSDAPSVDMAADSAVIGDIVNPPTDATGGNLSHENRQPSLAVSYIIALTGIYPSRS